MRAPPRHAPGRGAGQQQLWHHVESGRVRLSHRPLSRSVRRVAWSAVRAEHPGRPMTWAWSRIRLCRPSCYRSSSLTSSATAPSVVSDGTSAQGLRTHTATASGEVVGAAGRGSILEVRWWQHLSVRRVLSGLLVVRVDQIVLAFVGRPRAARAHWPAPPRAPHATTPRRRARVLSDAVSPRRVLQQPAMTRSGPAPASRCFLPSRGRSSAAIALLALLSALQ